MTSQFEAQRDELIDANRQLDFRRRFSEAVLSGVSAGVIGLDPRGRINLMNASAAAFFDIDESICLMASLWRPCHRKFSICSTSYQKAHS